MSSYETRGKVLRYLCLLTAAANMGGNLLLPFVYRPVFEWLGVPIPADFRAFLLESLLSFTMGVVALVAFLQRDRAIPLLQVGMIGKGTYALLGYYYFAFHELHWFYLVFVVWDAVYTVIFCLCWIHLESPDLPVLQGPVQGAADRPSSNRALVITFSLTGNGRKAVDQLIAGLESRGYRVDVSAVRPLEELFRFPMSFIDFTRIVVRALFRRPAQIAPLNVIRDDYDLVVVESQTWMLGMAAPVEAVFQNPANRWIFEGRDAAALVVCRGAHRRSRAMMVRWLERLGANVVAARGYGHEGSEPRRLMSLWFYLIFRRAGFPPGLAEPRYGLSDDSLREIRRWGQELAERTGDGEREETQEVSYV